jgi:hypothetical protein
MKHVHLEVGYLDERGGLTSFCMFTYGSWRVDKDVTASLVVGRKLNRVHIPLIAIAWFGPVEGPDWCHELPPKEEELGRSDVDAGQPLGDRG